MVFSCHFIEKEIFTLKTIDTINGFYVGLFIINKQ